MKIRTRDHIPLSSKRTSRAVLSQLDSSSLLYNVRSPAGPWEYPGSFWLEILPLPVWSEALKLPLPPFTPKYITKARGSTESSETICQTPSQNDRKVSIHPKADQPFSISFCLQITFPSKPFWGGPDFFTMHWNLTPLRYFPLQLPLKNR